MQTQLREKHEVEDDRRRKARLVEVEQEMLIR
jgi:hypothetical protein